MDRIKFLRKILKQKNLDSLIVFSPANITYLTAKLRHDAYLLVTLKRCFYLTDSRYIGELRRSLPRKFLLKEIHASLPTHIIDLCNENRLKRIGFEEDSTFYSTYRKLSRNLKKRSRLIPTSGLVEGLRESKSRLEIARIKKGVRIILEAFVFIRKFLKAGQKEIEIVAEFERFIRYNGAEDSAFDIIVAAGKNSAHPHHTPGQKKLVRGEPVLIDIGVECQGYKSDISRVFSVGKPSDQLDKVYGIVLKAQEAAIKAVKPGVSAGVIDSAGRRHIEKHGLGKYFVHSIGHGVGIKVHEGPHISPNSEEIIKPGMVFTLEPAVYLPGRFGIRIEDMVLVTKTGCQLLSKNIPK